MPDGMGLDVIGYLDKFAIGYLHLHLIVKYGDSYCYSIFAYDGLNLEVGGLSLY